MPHGWCFAWRWDLIVVHVLTDATIALAYCLIPTALWRLRRKVPSVMLFWFALFIFSCGMTHVMNIVVIWRPDYWLEAAVKGMTAASSMATAILLFKFVNALFAEI